MLNILARHFDDKARHQIKIVQLSSPHINHIICRGLANAYGVKKLWNLDPLEAFHRNAKVFAGR